MKMTFQDLEHRENPRNGTALSGTTSVSDLFASLEGRDPFIFELRSEAGYTLTTGFGGSLGFVQYSAADGEPPYAVALADAPTPSESKYFVAGGQQTEIPGRFCLPIKRVEAIVAEIMVTGVRSRSVAWEKI